MGESIKTEVATDGDIEQDNHFARSPRSGSNSNNKLAEASSGVNNHTEFDHAGTGIPGVPDYYQQVEVDAVSDQSGLMPQPVSSLDVDEHAYDRAYDTDEI